MVKDSTFARPTSWMKGTSTQERANNETQISPRLFPATGRGGRALLQKVLHDKIVEVLNIQRGKRFTWLFRGKRANIRIRLEAIRVTFVFIVYRHCPLFMNKHLLFSYVNLYYVSIKMDHLLSNGK